MTRLLPIDDCADCLHIKPRSASPFEAACSITGKHMIVDTEYEFPIPDWRPLEKKDG